MVADRGKKSKVAVKTEEDVDHIDSELVLSVENLQEVQDELEKVNEEACEKVLEVEQKYNEIRRPVYIKRNEVIKSIPDFWLTSFLNHPALGDLLSEEDCKIFKCLDSLDVEDFKDVKSGYSIMFNFKPNPHFEDTKLTKTFTFFDEGTTKITGTKINWKAGMGSGNGVNHENKGKKRPPSDESFFSWFGETQQKDNAEELHDQVAEIIKEDLWPNPLEYFNKDADDSDGDEDEEERCQKWIGWCDEDGKNNTSLGDGGNECQLTVRLTAIEDKLKVLIVIGIIMCTSSNLCYAYVIFFLSMLTSNLVLCYVLPDCLVDYLLSAYNC